MNRTFIIAIILLCVLFHFSCKTIKRNNCDCPNFSNKDIKKEANNL